MFAEKAIELLKDLERCPDKLPPYNDDAVRNILQEMDALYKLNLTDANLTKDSKEYWSAIQVRHSVIERNKRCLLAYLFNRISKVRTMRWEFGPVLPPDIKELLSEEEFKWFSQYSAALASYMRSIGQEIGYSGIDLTDNLRPPKTLYKELLCVKDYGELELEDGSLVCLKKNSRHFLPTSEYQMLIRQGVLEEIIS